MLGDRFGYLTVMQCLCPVTQDQTIAGTRALFSRRCGYCEACRLTYRQSWSARIQLEANCHAASCFFTLTYSDDFLPDPPHLNPAHLQLFLKRLRHRCSPVLFRFFACGEYGSRSRRPHYHGILFGLAASLELERLILDAWRMGFIQVGEFSPARAAYVAKYVCKEVSSDDGLPEGYPKEFARMSLRPHGIGAAYVDRLASAVNKVNDRQLSRGYPIITELVGGSMRIGPSYYPVARYLRARMKEAIKDQPVSDLGHLLLRSSQSSRTRADRVVAGLDVKTVKSLRRQARKRIDRSSGVL